MSLYGQPADFPAINAIADRYGLPVIEDGAQSFGQATRPPQLWTEHGWYYSFFPSNPWGYGDGGACFTNDAELAACMRRVSRHGQDGFHTDIGVNGRIDTCRHFAGQMAQL